MPHVLAQDLRNAVLQAAMQGKLSKQLKDDSSVDQLLIDIEKQKNSLINKKEMKKEKPLSLITDEEIPFDIPPHWEFVRTGDVIDCSSGSTPLKGHPEYYENGTIPWLKTGELNNSYITKCEEKITELAYKKGSFRMNQPGDVLIAMYGATIGKLGICTFPLTTNQACLGCTPLGGINNRYLFYFFMASKSSLTDKAEGGAQPNISRIKVRNHPMPLPPIEEQARIVARVDELMAKIDEYEKIENELTELQKAFPGNMKDAILQAAMQGKLTEQLSSDTDIRKYYEMVLSEEKIVSKKEKEVSFTGEEPFDIPSNWMWVKLNDLVGKEIRRGKSPKYAKNGTAMAFAQKCNSKHTGIRLDLALCLDDNSLSRYADHDKMQDLDVVINSTGGGTLGRIGLYKAEYNTDNKAYYPDSHVTVIRAKKCVSSLYIFRCLQYYSPYLETLGEGSTNQTELKPDVLKGLYIPLPPLEEQQRIVDKLDQLLPLCEQLERMAA